jgi:hypothetical protein
MGWSAWELTHSGALLGFASFAELVPALLIGPLAGAVDLLKRGGPLEILPGPEFDGRQSKRQPFGRH